MSNLKASSEELARLVVESRVKLNLLMEERAHLTETRNELQARYNANPLPELANKVAEMEATYVDLMAKADQIAAEQKDREAGAIQLLSTGRPHLVAEMLTRLVSKPKLADRIIDDRNEAFARNLIKYGSFRAHAYYWTDTVRSLWPAGKTLIGWLIAGEFLKKWSGS
ncbi:hypothetical protein [uncultured Methylobacterium sp.]|uniref:hypothetical protein n=1 Tax=uncultured Methylobacterium sp. TaxID=157278 RepID=UPI0035CBE239